MVYIYIKNKEIKKINDEEVVLIIGNKGKYEWEILTKDMKKFNVKKKSSKDVKKLTKKKYCLKVHENVWVNTCFFKKKDNTFTLDKIREHIREKNSNTCCYTTKCPSHCDPRWSQNDNIDNEDVFYKKSL